LNDNSIHYDAIDQKIISDYKVIINCTPLGMHPNENSAPEIPYHLLGPQHYLYDLVYKPAKTVFLKKGEERGATTENGYDMLLIQAEASWKIWNDL
jgi:shikimate dehydrogenase